LIENLGKEKELDLPLQICYNDRQRNKQKKPPQGMTPAEAFLEADLSMPEEA